VIRGFAEHVPANTGVHLLHAGPAVEAVVDDPEGLRVLRQSIAARALLSQQARSRVHLATLPMDDLDENAMMVNALQRHARVIAQKSLAEGFGLTVAEAMWKARPIVASRIGGIQDQIVHGESGLLLDDPRDYGAFGDAITGLLKEPKWAEELGRAARERVEIPQRAQPARLPRGHPQDHPPLSSGDMTGTFPRDHSADGRNRGGHPVRW
jgi:trehalose synthase